jgi:hypothetical protein
MKVSRWLPSALCFHVEAIRGRGAAQIAVYEPGETWQERHRLIDDVVMLDKHLRASPM